MGSANGILFCDRCGGTVAAGFKSPDGKQTLCAECVRTQEAIRPAPTDERALQSYIAGTPLAVALWGARALAIAAGILALAAIARSAREWWLDTAAALAGAAMLGGLGLAVSLLREIALELRDRR